MLSSVKFQPPYNSDDMAPEFPEVEYFSVNLAKDSHQGLGITIAGYVGRENTPGNGLPLIRSSSWGRVLRLILEKNLMIPLEVRETQLLQLPVGVCACIMHACVVCPSGFVQAITCTFMHGFQNNLAQLLSSREIMPYETFIQVG